MPLLSLTNTFWTLVYVLELLLRPITAALPRRITRGPLDAPDDPLSPTASAASPSEPPAPPLEENFPTNPKPRHGILDPPAKDFGFLLRSEIYHPLSQLDIPTQFRTHFPPPPNANLGRLLATGHFLPAAALSATLLTSPNLSPTNSSQIFSLLYTRLACLTLTGNTLLAAHESKCLEDLNSNFYYTETLGGSSNLDHDLEHMVPWELRVLAVRLQSIGFSDGKRGVGGYYELATETRQKIKKSTSPSDKALWKSRLADLGLRVVNAQIEMGDLSGAKHELEAQIHFSPDDQGMRFRLVLLLLRMGKIRQAREVLGPKPEDGTEGVLLPLLSMAEGKLDLAVQQWEDLNLNYVETDQEALIRQNLAVCYLYAGRMKEARSVLETLIDTPSVPSFHSLTFNLATLYELCSEKSRLLKGRLVDRVAKKSQKGEDGFEVCEDGWEKINADFKI